ncbi:uncharacterized protein PFLUO_LOCUS9523 [Penicillium psychrofluorescens]|uniref:uncharacterized protein n=1 Tax=Penicillium psychrofluorescens TaxID=3158075 RepID=UPI003CCCD94E
MASILSSGILARSFKHLRLVPVQVSYLCSLSYIPSQAKVAQVRSPGPPLLKQSIAYTHTRKMSTSTPILERYKLIFFVPPSHLELCKEAVFTTGAGSFPGGKYTKCAFQTRGTGQFLPNEGADPAIGAVGTLERCEELKVEIMCLGREVMLNAVKELVRAHPYEEVAYEVYRMEDL